MQAVACRRAGVGEVESANQRVDGAVVCERGRDLGRGQYGHGVEPFAGALRGRVEQPYRVDDVTPEVDPDGAVVAGTVDVEDATASCGGTRMVDDGPDPVAELRPVLEGRLDRDALAGGDGLGPVPERRGGEGLLDQAADRGDDERGLVSGEVEAAERTHPLMDGSRLDGEALVREHFGFREVAQRSIAAAVCLELAQEAAGVVGVGADDDERPPQMLPDRRDDEGLRLLRGGGCEAGAGGDGVDDAAVGGHSAQHVRQSDEAQWGSSVGQGPRTSAGRSAVRGVPWRREWDSNPRRREAQRFSRPPQSSTLPSLQRLDVISHGRAPRPAGELGDERSRRRAAAGTPTRGRCGFLSRDLAPDAQNDAHDLAETGVRFVLPSRA